MSKASSRVSGKYYPNDSLFSAGQYKDGMPRMGVFRTFYVRQEKKMAVLTYREGTDTGDMIIYNESGTLKAKGKYVSQKKDSVWNYYDEKGGAVLNRALYKRRGRRTLENILFQWKSFA